MSHVSQSCVLIGGDGPPEQSGYGQAMRDANTFGPGLRHETGMSNPRS
jgi:hypothetical protein